MSTAKACLNGAIFESSWYKGLVSSPNLQYWSAELTNYNVSLLRGSSIIRVKVYNMVKVFSFLIGPGIIYNLFLIVRIWYK